MKSRILLPSHLTKTEASSASGLLLARSPKGDVAAGAAVRRFELQRNQSPRFARRRQERRKGQALLLAVLIMLLAALLSAGFLAVVSGNLNQTARIADKTRAIEASRAGIAYANAQLSGSSQGDLWRPVDVSPVPNPNDSNSGYDFYYSQLDKVQGWALDPTTATRDQLYAKFPDPTQPVGDAPKFLVKVEEIPLNSTTEPEHAGELKITSIGLSDDDPNVFHRSVAYKVGRKKSPWASALRSVSNWDFKNQTVPQATLSALTTSTAPIPPTGMGNLQVTVNATTQQGQFPAVPFNAVVIHKDLATPANSRTTPGVITAVDNTNPANPIYTLSGTFPINPPSYAAGDTLQIAASLGTVDYVDYLNTGTAPAPGQINVPRQNQPNGLLINGSAALRGQIQMLDLRENGTKIQSSGAIYPMNSIPVTASGDVATAGNLSPSFLTNFPGSFTPASGIDKTDLVNDAWDKIGVNKTLGLDYASGTTRSVEPFTPVDIASQNNLNRYRALTRNSAAGVYIDNREDFEKVTDNSAAVPPTFKAMTQAQLVEMLVSPPVPVTVPVTLPVDYTRNGTATTTVGASLEQRHLRGWVGPDEFLARGALVELITSGTTPKIRVTYDARSDANPNGPELSKTFRDANGNLRPGVYSQELDWPSNGTLFAEGNIRIRGNVQLPVPPATGADPFPSLTVVSLNNIYIEGSVSVDNRLVGANPASDRKKLMLLAKKNVIVNPTRAVLARTDVATVATNPTGITIGTPSTSFNLPVANAYAFNKGDYLTFAAQKTMNDPTAVTVRGLVTSTQTTTSTQITIVTPDKGYLLEATNAIVRSPLEKRDVGTGISNRAFFSLVDTENAINRRLVSPISTKLVSADPNRNKLVFDHVGDLKMTGTTKDGLNIKAENLDATSTIPTGFIAELSNKQPVDASQDLVPGTRNVLQTNKLLRTYNNFLNLPTTTNQKDFNYEPAPTEKRLPQFVAEINAYSQLNPGLPPQPGYKYKAEMLPTTTDFSLIPSYALAGVGLRYDAGTAYDPSNPNRRQKFKTNTIDGFTIPLATSVEYDLNGGLSSLVSVTSSIVTKYIGFSPDLTNSDDAFTVDSSFYRTKDDVNKSSLDSRVFDSVAAPSGLAPFPQSIILKRSNELSETSRSVLLPDYRVRSMKMENVDLNARTIKPVAPALQVNAFVYAQEGSWFVIPGDYFRSDPPVRADVDAAGNFLGSYIDYNKNGASNTLGVPDPGEYILQGTIKLADLNRNGQPDFGEKEAALRFVRYNYAPIKFYGAIVENQTAIVTDVKDSLGTTILAKGAVQDWMDKWATYDDTASGAVVGAKEQFSFINYAYDPSLADGSVGANGLRVPVTDDLLYEQ